MHRLNLNGDLDERGSAFREINGEILKTRTLAKRSMGKTLLSSFSGFSSLSNSNTFSDCRASAFSQLARESHSSLDRTALFYSPQLDGGIKTPSARFIRCSGSTALGRPTHSYFTPAALT